MTSKLKVNNIEDTSGNALVTKCGSTLTIGKSGDTISLASGASQTGFGRSGSVNWQTTPKTATFTAVSGEGYFINSGSAITVNLPAGSAGAIVAVSDYARNFATYNLTISPNGSEKIGGVAQDLLVNVNGQALTLVYVDGTKGWINVQNAEDTETGTPPFIVATGGSITNTPTCRIHTFTSPGTFEVTSLSPTPANNAVGYLVVAGGGAGGDGGTGEGSGGAGAGGFREGRNNPITPYTASPLVTTGLTATVASFPITVGAGGGPSASGPSGGNGNSSKGSNSIFSTITSTGGGAGISGGATAARCASVHAGGSGGAGNGRSHPSGNAGNTPPVSPPQGNNGGAGTPAPRYAGGGGGGATAVGQDNQPDGHADGGAGGTTHITGSPVAYAGGGGGGNQNGPAPGAGCGGAGGGGDGGRNGPKAGRDATANTGGGGGGNSCGPSSGTQGCGGSGGSGIVIIRYKIA